MVLTDPPYNVDYEGAAGKVSNDKMKRDAFYDFILEAFRNIESAMKETPLSMCFMQIRRGQRFYQAAASGKSKASL